MAETYECVATISTAANCGWVNELGELNGGRIMRRVQCRPNVYRHDLQAPTWRQEVGAWLFVVVVIIILRGIYYLVEGI